MDLSVRVRKGVERERVRARRGAVQRRERGGDFVGYPSRSGCARVQNRVGQDRELSPLVRLALVPLQQHLSQRVKIAHETLLDRLVLLLRPGDMAPGEDLAEECLLGERPVHALRDLHAPVSPFRVVDPELLQQLDLNGTHLVCLRPLLSDEGVLQLIGQDRIHRTIYGLRIRLEPLELLHILRGVREVALRDRTLGCDDLHDMRIPAFIRPAHRGLEQQGLPRLRARVFHRIAALQRLEDLMRALGDRLRGDSDRVVCGEQLALMARVLLRTHLLREYESGLPGERSEFGDIERAVLRMIERTTDLRSDLVGLSGPSSLAQSLHHGLHRKPPDAQSLHPSAHPSDDRMADRDALLAGLRMAPELTQRAGQHVGHKSVHRDVAVRGDLPPCRRLLPAGQHRFDQSPGIAPHQIQAPLAQLNARQLLYLPVRGHPAAVHLEEHVGPALPLPDLLRGHHLIEEQLLVVRERFRVELVHQGPYIPEKILVRRVGARLHLEADPPLSRKEPDRPERDPSLESRDGRTPPDELLPGGGVAMLEDHVIYLTVQPDVILQGEKGEGGVHHH